MPRGPKGERRPADVIGKSCGKVGLSGFLRRTCRGALHALSDLFGSEMNSLFINFLIEIFSQN
jgi:hypothetical protein